MADEMKSVLEGLTPEVVPVEGADDELVAIGERYWALAGFDEELGTPVWCEKTSAIDTAGWGSKYYVIAAAGVRAMCAEHACPQCGRPLSLPSRTALTQLCNGGTPVCVECTESLTDAVARLLDPRRVAKRMAARERAEQQQALNQGSTR